WTVLLPIFALVMSIFAGFAMFSAGEIDIFSLAGWQRAFGGEAGPYALVFGSLVGWITAAICFPKVRRSELGQAAVHGAASLLPALVVLILAWILGSMFGALGTIGHVADLLGSGVSSGRLPMAVFLTAAAMSFTTGSSWATMGLLMPIALPAVVASATASGMSASEIQHLVPWVIGAVFGGATLGDHCSPFSDTTIVSALASGCRTQDHVISQLSMVGMVFVCCIIAYALMSLGLAPIIATLLSGIVLGGWLCILKAVQRRAM
ncbi:MAG: Na+/H+ antiporter NhaC family protein, partial [Luteolibacter sp.]